MRAASHKHTESIAALLAPVRRKLWLGRIVHYSITGLIAGSAGGITILLGSWLWPIWYAWRWAVITVFFGWAVGALYGLIKRPSITTAAQFADRHGLQERMMTALTFERDRSAIARLQRTDAMHTFRCHEAVILKHVNVWVFPRWAVMSLCGLVITGAVLWWLPNPMDQVVRQQQQTAQVLEEERKKVADVEEKLAENDDIPEKTKQELLENVQDLQKQLQEAKNATDRMKAYAEMEAKLDELARQTAASEEVLSQLPNQLAAHAALASASQALAEGDKEKLMEALNEMHNLVKQLSPEERQALVNRLMDAATALEGNELPAIEGMASSLRKAAEHVQAGQTALAVQALGATFNQSLSAGQSLAVTQQTLANVSQSIGNSKAALAQVSGSDATLAQSSPGTGNPPGNSVVNGTNNTAENAGQSGTGNGNTNGSGSGVGSGRGNGQSTGSGTGSGLGNGSGSGSGAGSGSGSRELVSVPTERLTGGGPEDTVGGSLGEGRDEETIRSTIGTPGVTRPYSDVFRHYEAVARQSLETSDIPPQLQHLIRDYFSDIRPD